MFEGLLNNLLITGGSCILPLIVGVVSYFLCDKNKQLSKLAHFCGMFFESFCPLLTITVMYFCVLSELYLNPMVICIVGFAISFIGYMPTKYNCEYSLYKNIAVHGLGLVSVVFKWSFVARFVGFNEMLGYAYMQRARTYESYYLWIPFVISFGIIFILEIMRFLVKENMK